MIFSKSLLIFAKRRSKQRGAESREKRGTESREEQRAESGEEQRAESREEQSAESTEEQRAEMSRDLHPSAVSSRVQTKGPYEVC